MGWYTSVPTVIDFYKETYDSMEKVDDAIEENEKAVAELREQLQSYSLSHPKDWIDGEDIRNMTDLRLIVRDCLDELQRLTMELLKLRCLKDNYKCVSGDYVKNKDLRKNVAEWLEESGVNEWIDIYENEGKEAGDGY